MRRAAALNNLGTLENPGNMSALPPTMTMRAGEVLQDYLGSLRNIFPEANPIGQAIEDFMLQPSEEMAAQMVEGNPNAVFDTRAGQQLINPALLEALGLVPGGAVAKAPSTLIPGGMFAASKALERGLGVSKAGQGDDFNFSDFLLALGLGNDPRTSVLGVTETPRKINKEFPQGTEPTDSYAAIVKKSPPGYATLDPEGGAYWEGDQWLNTRTGEDVGEGIIQNAVIGVDFKKPNVLDATGKPKTKVFMQGGDVINQDIAYLDYKNAAGKNTKSSGIDEIEINLRKSDTFGEAAWLGGNFPKGMENQSIVSLVTKPRYSDNFSKNQHFYTVKTNVIGQGYLKKGAKAEQELMAKTDYTYTGGKKKGQPITEREQRKRITQNPRAKVLVTGEVTIDTRKSNIIGHIKKTPQGKTKDGVPILKEIQKLTAQGKHKDAQELARGEVSEKTANLKYDDNNIMYYPVYKEVWVDGKDLPL